MKSTRTLSVAALAAFALLSACNQQEAADTNVTAAVNQVEEEVPLPMIVKSTPYRCADGSTAAVDFFNTDTQVVVKLDGAELGTVLTTDVPGPDATFTHADGWSLKRDGDNVLLASPEKPEQLCKS